MIIRILCMLLLISCGQGHQNSKLHDFSEFTAEKKLQDLNAVISIIEEHYAMIDYKEKRFDFSWTEKKEEFRQRVAKEDIGRSEFEQIVQEMVSLFKDGHVNAILGRSFLLEDPKVTTLGFLVEYNATTDTYSVSEVLPHIFEQSPFKSGDEIVAIDDRPIQDVVNEDILRFTNTGHDRANKKIAASLLTVRLPNMFAKIPEGIANITIKRGGQEYHHKTPWLALTQTDIFFMMMFGQEDSYSTLSKKNQNGEFVETKSNKLEAILNLMQPNDDIKHDIAASFPSLIASSISDASDKPQTFLRREQIQGFDFDLYPLGEGWVAIYRIEDFVASRLKCAGGKCEVIKGEEYARAFSQLKSMDVHTLILDLRSNGGGYLSAGYELLRAFDRSLEVGPVELRLNEDWVGQFRMLSETPLIPFAQRYGYQQSYKTLLKDVDAKKTISSPVSLVGTNTIPGVEKPWEGQTIILIDEMCASMCDIFSVSMQDLKLATIMGTQSMGAGGNVICFRYAAPNQKISVSITASRMQKLDGTLIENEGAHPDIETETTTGSDFWKTVQDQVKTMYKAAQEADAEKEKSEKENAEENKDDTEDSSEIKKDSDNPDTTA